MPKPRLDGSADTSCYIILDSATQTWEGLVLFHWVPSWRRVPDPRVRLTLVLEWVFPKGREVEIYNIKDWRDESGLCKGEASLEISDGHEGILCEVPNFSRSFPLLGILSKIHFAFWTLQKQNHIIYTYFCLGSFAQHYICEIHPYCWM